MAGGGRTITGNVIVVSIIIVQVDFVISYCELILSYSYGHAGDMATCESPLTRPKGSTCSSWRSHLVRGSARIMYCNYCNVNVTLVAFARAAAAFDVPNSTLHERVKGGATRQLAQVKNRKLLPTEEAALIRWIESLDDRGMSPTIGYIRQMADLLRERGSFMLLDASLTSTPAPAMTVGENWVQRLLHRHPHLEYKYSRKYDYQRALCEDPEKISAWFACVQKTINEYSDLLKPIQSLF
jgi:hypothetical protein